MRQQAEIAKSNTLRRTNDIKNISKDNEDLEKEINEMKIKAVELKAKLEAETNFYLKHTEDGNQMNA